MIDKFKECFQEEHQFRLLAEAISAGAGLYERIKNGDIKATPELKKAVQSSLIELCTALSVAIKED